MENRNKVRKLWILSLVNQKKISSFINVQLVAVITTRGRYYANFVNKGEIIWRLKLFMIKKKIYLVQSHNQKVKVYV